MVSSPHCNRAKQLPSHQRSARRWKTKREVRVEDFYERQDRPIERKILCVKERASIPTRREYAVNDVAPVPYNISMRSSRDKLTQITRLDLSSNTSQAAILKADLGSRSRNSPVLRPGWRFRPIGFPIARMRRCEP